MKKFLYIDESGDLGFNFTKKNPSSFFTITLLLVDEVASNTAIKKIVEKVLRRKLNGRKNKKRIVSELKGTNTTLGIKKYFYKQVQSEKISIYSITLNKRNVNIDLQNNPHRLYNWIIKQLIDKVSFSSGISQLILFLDKAKNKKQIQDCNNYLLNYIEGRLPLSAKIDIFHEDSQKIRQLQVVDLFCYGIARKYNQNDSDWFDVFAEKVAYEELFFR